MARFMGVATAAVALALGGCQSVQDFVDPLAADVAREFGLEEDIANSPDVGGAAEYFEEAVAEEPETPDLRRDLAAAYVRDGRPREAREVYADLAETGAARPEDIVEAAMLDIELDRWHSAQTIAATLPETFRSPRRHLLDALLADRAGDWEAADIAYAAGVETSPAPAAMMNNWGVSLMARRELSRAEATLQAAVAIEPQFFAAKNNMAIARALQGEYDLPSIAMDDSERALLLNNMGLIAMRRGDTTQARALFAEAVETHPQHFPAAARHLAALTR